MKIDYILYGNDDGICVETYNYKREERLSHMTNYMFGLFILLTNDIYGIIELIGDISKKHINSDGTFNNNPILNCIKNWHLIRCIIIFLKIMMIYMTYLGLILKY